MKAIPAITQDMLPEGWTLDGPYHTSTVLKAPGQRGYLSIDPEIRAWAPGTCPVYFHHGQPEFKGRGWLQALVTAAIKDFESRFN